MYDEIIKKLWEIKDGMAQEYDHNLDKFIAHLQNRQRKADEKVVDLRAIKAASERTDSAKPNS